MNYLDQILASRTATAQVGRQFSVAYPLIILCGVYRFMLHVCMYESVHCVTSGLHANLVVGAAQRGSSLQHRSKNKYRTMLTIIKGSCPWKHAPYTFNRLLHTHSDYCEKKKLRRKLQISNNERAPLQAPDPTFRSVYEINWPLKFCL